MLIVENVTKEFPRRGGALDILRGVSFQLAPGGALAVMGPSGCGKSTLLNILGTLEPPTSGRVTIGGEDPFRLAPQALARFRNRRIGFVFQEHHLLPHLTALENVLLPALARGEGADLSDKAVALLGRVGLSDRRDHFPAEMSGGERQRAAIARALLLSPSVVLADEPTGNLDRRTAGEIADLLSELPRADKVALVVVTHSEALAARFDRTCELIDGVLADKAAAQA
ncbi:MAG: Lipoprotein-releasing system ATP-binding protein LolD [Phycisphaerae bacterium]|nr:Lipoprotein-releasing system ATP-binding protein LolD [Phycisphaerae bacterium]